ncbi:MAG: ABC transporter permease [Brevefilum sp.]
MGKIWQIIKYEYRRHVFQKRFLFSLLSLPVAAVAMILVGLLVGALSIDASPVGYIDHSGVIRNTNREGEESSLFEPIIEFKSYQEEDQARADLEAEDIQAYYVIPENYPQSTEIELVYYDQPGTGVQGQFIQLIRNNLDTFEGLDPQIRQRLQQGATITVTSLDGSREMREDQWFMIFTPMISGIMFLIVVMTSGGYLLQAVVEEKENRTMEIVITSVTPNQLMTGKIIGNIAVGLTQLVIWLIFGWIAILVGGFFWQPLEAFSLPTDFALVLFLLLLPAFVMISAFMAAIGSTMTEMQEAQQVSSMLSLPITIPFYLTTPLMMNPNGTLAVALSYFPLTAPITILMRMAFTVVPIWQIVTSVALLVLFAVLAIWFAGRAFRMGMLRYGKKLQITEIFGKRVEK